MSRPQPEALAAFQRQRSAQRRSAVIAAIGKLDRAGSAGHRVRGRRAGGRRSQLHLQTRSTCSTRSANGARSTSQAGAAPGSRAGDGRVAASPAGQRPRRDRTAESREPHDPRAARDRSRRRLGRRPRPLHSGRDRGPATGAHAGATVMPAEGRGRRSKRKPDGHRNAFRFRRRAASCVGGAKLAAAAFRLRGRIRPELRSWRQARAIPLR